MDVRESWLYQLTWGRKLKWIQYFSWCIRKSRGSPVHAEHSAGPIRWPKFHRLMYSWFVLCNSTLLIGCFFCEQKRNRVPSLSSSILHTLVEQPSGKREWPPFRFEIPAHSEARSIWRTQQTTSLHKFGRIFIPILLRFYLSYGPILTLLFAHPVSFISQKRVTRVTFLRTLVPHTLRLLQVSSEGRFASLPPFGIQWILRYFPSLDCLGSYVAFLETNMWGRELN